MAKQTTKPYTVRNGFNPGDRMYVPGETVYLTDEQHEAYGAHVDGDQYAAGVAYLPGQEPQPAITGQDPLTQAQAAAGDPVAAADVAGRTANGGETRGDTADVETDATLSDDAPSGGTTREARVSMPRKAK